MVELLVKAIQVVEVVVRVLLELQPPRVALLVVQDFIHLSLVLQLLALVVAVREIIWVTVMVVLVVLVVVAKVVVLRNI
jgi:hypothetical protein